MSIRIGRVGLLILVLALPVACTVEREPDVGTAASQTAGVPADWPESFGFGTAASAEEIRAWDIDVRPDGTGLPPGGGTAAEGEAIYRERCAACHGPTGREGPNDLLVGREPREGFPFAQSPELREMRTIGNYWPYATTLYDYINRAMPQNAPGSLSADEVYAVTAFLLYTNQLITPDAVINAETLPAVTMPARGRFVPDDRRGGPELR